VVVAYDTVPELVPAEVEVLGGIELDGVAVGMQSGRVNVPLILPEPP
jgi:hypothetical protein